MGGNGGDLLEVTFRMRLLRTFVKTWLITGRYVGKATQQTSSTGFFKREMLMRGFIQVVFYRESISLREEIIGYNLMWDLCLKI